MDTNTGNVVKSGAISLQDAAQNGSRRLGEIRDNIVSTTLET